MEENRKKKFRQQVMQRAKKRGNDISPFDANQNSFEVVVTLMPASETLHVANSFFHEKILPAYTECKSRILKIEHKKRQFYCLACSLSFASAVRPLRVALNSNYYTAIKIDASGEELEVFDRFYYPKEPYNRDATSLKT